MTEFGIPTAAYRSFRAEEADDAKAFLRTLAPPYVLKADGLAAGKGVVIVDELARADAELDAMLAGKFGDASATVVIEEFLRGPEFSVFVLTDGTDYQLLPVARDYKRVGVGDTGPNTDGTTAFLAGVAEAPDGRLVTSGGRVLALTSYGLTYPEAAEMSRRAAAEVEFEGAFYRDDVGRQ